MPKKYFNLILLKKFNIFKLLHFICIIIILLLILFLAIISTIFSEDEELSAHLIYDTTVEITREISFFRHTEPPSPSPIPDSPPDPVPESPSSDESFDNTCPCCRNNLCNCNTRDMHHRTEVPVEGQGPEDTEAPVEGQGVHIPEDSDRRCCHCGEFAPTVACYSCECTFCDSRCADSHEGSSSEAIERLHEQDRERART